MNNMVRLGEQEWKKIKETSRVIVKDTLGLDSLLLVYYKNGQLYSREPYKNGKLCGYYEEYYSNGQLRFREYRKIGGIPEDCYFYCYDIDGSILQEGKIKNGVQVGVWIHYTFRAPFKQYIYSNNGKLKKIKTWDEDLKKWKRTGFM